MTFMCLFGDFSNHLKEMSGLTCLMRLVRRQRSPQSSVRSSVAPPRYRRGGDFDPKPCGFPTHDPFVKKMLLFVGFEYTDVIYVMCDVNL